MNELTREELFITKKLFLTSINKYFNKPEQLNHLVNAYTKIIGGDIKEDWEELSSLLLRNKGGI